MALTTALGLLVVFLGVSSGQLRALPHSLESACFLDHFKGSSCPYTELTACIKELGYYFSYSYDEDNAIKIHLAMMATEKRLCEAAKPSKTQCIHKEIVRCTTSFDILDVSESIEVCNQVPKTVACLAKINQTCKDPSFRKAGLLELISDRVRIAGIECNIGYYDKHACSDEAIIGCLNQFLENGAECRSSERGYAGRCLIALENRCQTTASQELVQREQAAFEAICPY